VWSRKIDCDSYIVAVITEYGWPFTTDIEALYAFDVSGRLTDIDIRRTVDAF
jgi:hypothetical protein